MTGKRRVDRGFLDVAVDSVDHGLLLSNRMSRLGHKLFPRPFDTEIVGCFGRELSAFGGDELCKGVLILLVVGVTPLVELLNALHFELPSLVMGLGFVPKSF